MLVPRDAFSMLVRDRRPRATRNALAASKRLSRAQEPKIRDPAPTDAPLAAQPAAPRRGEWSTVDRQRALDGPNQHEPLVANRPNAPGSKILFLK